MLTRRDLCRAAVSLPLLPLTKLAAAASKSRSSPDPGALYHTEWPQFRRWLICPTCATAAAADFVLLDPVRWYGPDEGDPPYEPIGDRGTAWWYGTCPAGHCGRAQVLEKKRGSHYTPFGLYIPDSDIETVGDELADCVAHVWTPNAVWAGKVRRGEDAWSLRHLPYSMLDAVARGVQFRFSPGALKLLPALDV
jgi:hypothetical protein